MQYLASVSGTVDHRTQFQHAFNTLLPGIECLTNLVDSFLEFDNGLLIRPKYCLNVFRVPGISGCCCNIIGVVRNYGCISGEKMSEGLRDSIREEKGEKDAVNYNKSLPPGWSTPRTRYEYQLLLRLIGFLHVLREKGLDDIVSILDWLVHFVEGVQKFLETALNYRSESAFIYILKSNFYLHCLLDVRQTQYSCRVGLKFKLAFDNLYI